MQTFNEDININGSLSAVRLDGELTDKTIQPFVDKLNEQAENIAALSARLTELNSELINVKDTYVTLAQKYNEAIAIIKNLSDRLAELEKNYDPTVIG